MIWFKNNEIFLEKNTSGHVKVFENFLLNILNNYILTFSEEVTVTSKYLASV